MISIHDKSEKPVAVECWVGILEKTEKRVTEGKEGMFDKYYQ